MKLGAKQKLETRIHSDQAQGLSWECSVGREEKPCTRPGVFHKGPQISTFNFMSKYSCTRGLYYYY